MVGTIARMNAALTWDLDDFDRGTVRIGDTFDRVRGMVAGLGEAFAEAGRKMTLAVTGPLAAFGIYAVKLTSDAEELQSAFDYTFGAMSTRMNKWADDTGEAMGRTTTEMQKGALAFGQLFRSAAPTEESMASLSQRFTELAQDAASFYNVDFDTAMQKIRSGLTGESEPLRDFGVFLNDAAVEARGLQMGLIEAGEELNEQGKIMARAALIAEGLADANGDVARTGESLANQVRSLTAEITELAQEFGQRLMPYAEAAIGWLRQMVQRIRELPEWVKDAATQFAVFAAALGPVAIAISAIAAVALPLMLSRMGPVMMILSAIINPLGTAAVMVAKLASEFGFIGAAVMRVAPLFLRFMGPIGVATALFLTFKDDVLEALETISVEARDTLGPKLQELFAGLSASVESLNDALRALTESEFGQWLDLSVSSLGDLVQAFLELGGQVVIDVIAGLIDTIREVADVLRQIGNVVTALFQGEWMNAWQLAASAVDGAVGAMIRSIGTVFPTLRGVIDLMEYAGLIKPAAKPEGNAGSSSNGWESWAVRMYENWNRDLDVGGGNYAETQDEKPSRRSSGGGGGRGRVRQGPSAEELQLRREELRLQQQLDVAREKGDLDAERAIERKLDLMARVEDYERAGLSHALAMAASEKDLQEIDEARAVAQAKALATDERQMQMRIAELRGNFERLRQLEDEEAIEREIEALQRNGLNLAQAEIRAQENLAELDAARAEATARRLRDQQAAHDIELARLRGDTVEQLRALEEADRMRRRSQELEEREDMSPADAKAMALKESLERDQAYLVGTFRDSFRSGLRAALDGDLGGFFETWMKDRTFNALADVLDRLASNLANMFSRSGGGGGLFGGLLGSVGSSLGFGSVLSGNAAAASAGAGYDWTPIGFDTGGELQIRGFPGVDQNLLSLNGNPLARVSQGEILNVRKGAIARANDNGGSGGDTYNYYTLPSDEFWGKVDGVASNRSGSTMAKERARSAQKARRKFQ